MSEKKWYYTDSLGEASLLLRNKTILPHGGGTHLNNRDLSHVKGLLCMKGLKLNYIKQNNDGIEIGAMSTYGDIIEKLREISPHNLLLKSLYNAANTPLRNRITIGGSVNFIPQWSDLIGALLALNATVILAGKHEGEYPISKFWNNKSLRESSLITAVKFRDFPHLSHHYRDVKTNNDMPLFTVTTLLEMDSDKIDRAKVYIAGTKERVSQLTELENYLSGKKIEELKEKEAESLVNVAFAGKRVQDSDYLQQKAKITTWRSVLKALEAKL
ncbi:MAG: FAD binding domain-containing protein [Fidelibacterota bacterium]